MTLNVGTVDRILRFIIGFTLLALGYTLKSWWGLVGLVPVVTGLVGWCPAYVPVRINTGRKQLDRP